MRECRTDERTVVEHNITVDVEFIVGMVAYKNGGFDLKVGTETRNLLLIADDGKSVQRHDNSILGWKVIDTFTTLDRDHVDAIILTEARFEKRNAHIFRELGNGDTLHRELMFHGRRYLERNLCLTGVEIGKETRFDMLVEAVDLARETDNYEHKDGDDKDEAEGEGNVAADGDAEKQDDEEVAKKDYRDDYGLAVSVFLKEFFDLFAVEVF